MVITDNARWGLLLPRWCQ